MHDQGDGTCLLGECNDGYKCDCFGFEQCSRSSCSIFTNTQNVVPSTYTPFQCNLTLHLGRCTVFEQFLETANAADNAKLESTRSSRETDTTMMDVIDDVQHIQGDKVTMEQKVEELDSFAEEVTDEERKQLEGDVKAVVEAIQKVQEELRDLQDDLEEATGTNYKVGKFRRMCHHKEKEATEKEAEERAEATKPKNKDTCNRCDVLNVEIKALRKECRDAAKAAGEWTKKVQNAKNKGRKRRKNVKKIRLSAQEAHLRCIDRSKKILSRLINTIQVRHDD